MIRKIFILTAVFLLSNLQGFCFSDNEISYLEISQYGKSFEQDSFSERLARLENDVLGMTQSGEIEKRIKNLYKVVGNSIVLPDPRNSEVNNKKSFKDFWNNMTSGLLNSNGYMTGYIPPITTNLGGNSSDFFDIEPICCPHLKSYHHKHRHSPRIGRHNFHNNYTPNYYNPYGTNQYRPTYGMRNVSTASTVRILND